MSDIITERGDPRDRIANQQSLPPNRRDTLMATKYVVLALDGKDNKWELIATVEASSDSTAKKKALATNRPEGATVVAVPERSWKPEDLKPKLSFV